MAANGPPKDAEPGELWLRLTELPRPVSGPHPFHARGTEVGKLVFRVLTAEELSFVRIEASRSTKAALGEDAKAGNLAYEEEYEQQKAYQLLQLACRQAEDRNFPAFPRPADVKAQLTDDEIAVALTAYAQFRRESGPMISMLTPAEMEAWIRILQEGASRFPLARLSGEALIDLIMYLVSKLGPSATATSSPGSPQGESASPNTE